MMRKTLYQGQPLLDLLNMRAGDKHTIDEKRSHYVMGSKKHHRNMGLNEIARLLEGTKKRGVNCFTITFWLTCWPTMLFLKVAKNTTI